MKRKLLVSAGILTIGTLCFSGNAFAAHTHPISDVDGLQAALDSKADNTTVDALSATVDTKAAQADLDATNAAVATKADQADLDATNAAVATKAAQADLDATNAAVATKATQADLDATNAAVATKADGDHLHSYGNMTVVATSGGNYSDPVSAMNDIASWCGTPGAANPCLMKIMPGVYEIGANTLTLSSYVDIEGSGENVTVITKSGAAAATNDCVVDTSYAFDSEISGLTLQRNGQGDGTVGVLYGRSNAITLSDLSVLVTNGTSMATAIINDYGSSVVMDNVHVDSCKRAFDLDHNTYVELKNSSFYGDLNGQSAYLTGIINASAVISNSTFVNSWPSYAGVGLHIVFYPIPYASNGNEYKVDIRDTTVYGDYRALSSVNGVNLSISDTEIASDYNGYGTALYYSGSQTIKVSDTKLNGGLYVSSYSNAEIVNTQITGTRNVSGTIKCLGVYDGNLDEVLCP